MDKKQFAFIICTDNMQYYNECVRYIGDLEVPEGYSTDIICIQEAESMAQGYNAGMQESTAKYKVYLHQDTFILNTHLLYDIIDIFEKDESIGMIGVLGTEELPTDADCSQQWDVGAALVYDTKEIVKKIENRQDRIRGYMPVTAVDGLIMITQTDIPWREDFLDGWDFCDVSQSLEMKKNGYQIVVAYQEEPWCYHDCREYRLENYEYYRHKMVREYPKYFREDENIWEGEDLKRKKNREEIIKIREGMYKIATAGAYEKLSLLTNRIRRYDFPDAWIQDVVELMDIYLLERTGNRVSEWWELENWEQIYEDYRWLHFVMLRVGYQKDDERIEELKNMMKEGRISKDAIRHTSYMTLPLEKRKFIYETFLKEDYEEPLISVVIPVHNGAEFVGETIESVLNQTYQNMEIIIIDDASTDNSREIIDSYYDVRIKTIFSKKNGNICSAGNLGFQVANGKYVAIIGHDDIWESTKLEKQVAFLEEHPAYSVSFTWVDIIDEERKIVNEECNYLYRRFCTQNEIDNQQIRELFFNGNFFCAPSACIRKKYLDKTRYYNYGLVQLQDYELWMRLLCYGPAFIFYEKMTLYRRFKKKGQNLSAINTATKNRTTNENQYVENLFLDGLSNEQFVWIFGNDMRNKDSRSEKEIQCEKAFLLYNRPNYYFIKRFMELLNDEETRKLLSERYHFELQDFYEMNAKEMVFNY